MLCHIPLRQAFALVGMDIATCCSLTLHIKLAVSGVRHLYAQYGQFAICRLPYQDLVQALGGTMIILLPPAPMTL